MVRRRTGVRARNEWPERHPMQRCATCGKTEDLRLYFLQSVAYVERRWWCPECWFAARRLGLNAEIAPVWIERAALNRLPMKPLETGWNPSPPTKTFPGDAPDGPTLRIAVPTATIGSRQG
jgi:hypothetical protein